MMVVVLEFEPEAALKVLTLLRKNSIILLILLWEDLSLFHTHTLTLQLSYIAIQLFS
jgi:hypothetical protein